MRGSSPARSKALGSEPSLVGVRAFESHLPHCRLYLRRVCNS